MILKNTLYTLLISSALCLSGITASAQQLISEPAGGMDESEMDAAEALLPPSTTPIPSILDIPAVNRYYKSWDTLYVRRYSEIPPSTDDSIRLPLFSEYSTGFVFPVKGQLLSPFGYRGRRVHTGMDIKLEAGDPVSVAFDGVVRMARYYKGYGNCVVVRHYNGVETLYGHLSRIKVKVNDQVKAGDVIGLGGHTGRATCNHLHFETRFQGKAFNPKQMVDINTFALVADTMVITKYTFGLKRDYLPSAASMASYSDDNNAGHKSTGSKGKKFHTIKQGDTLGGLAVKYHTSVKQICSINGIRSGKTLQIGKRIRVR
jgi:hypothetical protein